jgi:hypothetical protein
LGPAARWCLVAGIGDDAGDAPDRSRFEVEADLIVSEGLAPVAFRALGDCPEHRDTDYFKLFHWLTLNAEVSSMAADAAGAKVLADLEARGIPAAVVKGPAAARLHPHGWPRPYADIDVLIARADYARAIECAHEAGFSYSDRAVPQWEWFDLYCREGINLHSPSGGNIDFHHHLPPWVLGSHLPVGTVIDRAQDGDLCGNQLRFAAPEDLMMVAALHILNDLWKGKLGLTSWRDVLVVIHRVGHVAAREAFDLAGLAWLFDLLVDELVHEVPESGIGSAFGPVAPPVAARFRLAALGWSVDAPSATRHRLAWATRLPPLNALAFLSGTAVPSADYIRSRHGTYRSYWRRSWAETVSTAHGSDYRMTTVNDYAATADTPG